MAELTELAPSKSLPPPESVSVGMVSSLPVRLALFRITDEDLAIARAIWAAVEPEAESIAEAFWEQWRGMPADDAWASGESGWDPTAGVSYIRNRYLATRGPGWVRAAERTVAEAFANGLSLSATISMTCAGAARTLEILSRRIDCSKEERLRINDVFLRLRSLECDVFSSLYAAHMGHDSRHQRDQLADEFRRGVAKLVEDAKEGGGELRSPARDSADSSRGVLGKTSEVEDARVEAAAEIATRASAQAGQAVGHPAGHAFHGGHQRLDQGDRRRGAGVGRAHPVRHGGPGANGDRHHGGRR